MGSSEIMRDVALSCAGRIFPGAIPPLLMCGDHSDCGTKARILFGTDSGGINAKANLENRSSDCL